VLGTDRVTHDNTGDPMPHYPNHRAVLETLASGVGVEHGRSFLPWMQRLPAPCMAARCDDCGAEPANDADDACRTIHFAELDQARAYLDDWEWAADVPIRCRWCRARRVDWPAPRPMDQSMDRSNIGGRL